MSAENFEKDFNKALSEAVKNGGKDKTLNHERFEILQSIYSDVIEVFGVVPKMTLAPNRSSGSISFEVEEFDVSGKRLDTLREILNECNNVSIMPLANGNIRASATLNAIFYD